MTRDRRIHTSHAAPFSTLLLPVRLQYRVPPSPAKANGADLVRAGDHANGIDEAVDEGAGDTFAVFGEPGAESCGDDGGVFGFVGDT